MTSPPPKKSWLFLFLSGPVVCTHVSTISPQEMQRDSQGDDGFNKTEILSRKLIWLPHQKIFQMVL